MTCSHPSPPPFMRPEVLFDLFVPVSRLKGVGPNLEKALGRLGIERAVHLLWHLPYAQIDRRPVASLAEADVHKVATVDVTIGMTEKAPSSRAPWRIFCQDSRGEELTLVYFSAKGDYLARLLPEGKIRRISGVLEPYGSRLQMVLE